MTDVYKLHGGPWHGRTVIVEEGRDHLHILEPVGIQELGKAEGTLIPDPIRTREGMYSRITRMPGHMEWDGWRSHD